MHINVGDYLLGDDDELVKVTSVNIDIDRIHFKIIDDPNDAYGDNSKDQLDWYYYTEISCHWTNYGKAYNTPLWKTLNG